MTKRILALGLLVSLLLFTGCGKTEREGKITLHREALEELTIKLTSGSLSLEATDGEPYGEYSIITTGFSVGTPEVAVHTVAGKTEITQRTGGIVFGSMKFVLTLYLPPEAIRTLALNMTSGSAKMDGLTVDACDISLTSGNVSFSGSVREEIDMDITSGTVKFSTETLPDSVGLKLTSGTAKLSIPSSEGHTLTYKRTSGTIKTEFSSSPDGEPQAMQDKHGSVTWGNGKCQINVDLTSGNFALLQLS